MSETTESKPTDSKQTTNEQPTIQKISQRRILRDVFFVVIVIAGILAFLLWPKAQVEIPMRTLSQLPYVFNEDYYKKLDTYLHQLNHEKILVLYGPQGVGKTAGIFDFIQRLNKQEGRLIIDFDFSQLTKYSNIFDLTSYLQYNVLHSLQLFVKNTRGGNLKYISPIIAKYDNICPQGFNPVDISFIKDQTLYNVTKQFNDKLSYLTKSPQLASRSFFESLNALSDVAGPIVFVHSPEILIGAKSKSVRDVVQSIISEAEKSALNGNLTVVFEISDLTAFIDGRFHPARYQYLLTEVQEFSPRNAEKPFIKGNHFTRQQFQEIEPICRGNGKCYSMINTMLNDGMSLKDSLEEIENDAKRKVYSSFATLNNTADALGFFKEIITNGNIPIEKSKEFSLHFLHHDVVSIANNTRITFQNAATLKAARALVGNAKINK
ncbi:hypothetical protein TVAG_083250 [Trichomonas vaginalis G3]|uniref:ATPase domain-containing protein n=1 Tax=Trichomonas vaginalis (strain ATCC PRA-98 / G3) TaxID=412133 RepID=A2DM52_TRIV3|nr:P-loop containing nucleoside triphosphate hydrolases family [Trichomonas vaginalis G3]EAY18472.1 hypothetical protein TVAG_083250 [Trichomonas vaginalis G3]KAI5489539.1 P-loop containing nucleoside triphosphate hydrolases family [Trichomonas vaginalis G3]|eukprot:XP_001579458.1 hypothetical protein [Trichomonas vaginalis G3]